jgi:hypothetical protein
MLRILTDALSSEERMTPYENRSGDSPITSYEIGIDHIIVEYRDSWRYLYRYGGAGRVAVEEMKRLALAGKGLSGYISRERPPYESKARK